MSPFADHPIARWALPAGAVVLIAAGTLVATRTASADSGLQPRTAAQLLVDVQQSATRQLSGTVVQTASTPASERFTSSLVSGPRLAGRASGRWR